jgi:hypothetical protein
MRITRSSALLKYESMSVYRITLTRKRSSVQDLDQAQPGTAEKYRNRRGNQQTSMDFDGRAASLGTRVFERHFDESSTWNPEGQRVESGGIGEQESLIQDALMRRCAAKSGHDDRER